MSFLRATALLSRQQAPLAVARASLRALSSVSKLTIVGTVGNDPEAKFFDNGSSQVSFSVATNEFVAGKEETTWHRVQLSPKQKASNFVMDYVRKGDKVYVEGRLKMSKYTNKEGVEVDTHALKAFEVSKISWKKDASDTEIVEESAGSSNSNNSHEYSSPPQKRKYASFPNTDGRADPPSVLKSKRVLV